MWTQTRFTRSHYLQPSILPLLSPQQKTQKTQIKEKDARTRNTSLLLPACAFCPFIRPIHYQPADSPSLPRKSPSPFLQLKSSRYRQRSWYERECLPRGIRSLLSPQTSGFVGRCGAFNAIWFPRTNGVGIYDVRMYYVGLSSRFFHVVYFIVEY